MKVGVIKYHCLKCSKSIILQYHPDLRTWEENPMIERLFNSKLCINCYTNKSVEELVECLLN